MITPESLAFFALRFTQIVFDDLEDEGLSLKLLVPEELAYSGGSAALTLDHGAFSLEPVFVGPAPEEIVVESLAEIGVDTVDSVKVADRFYFMVFSLPGEQLERDSDGIITFNVNVTGRPRLPLVIADLDRRSTAAFDPERSGFDVEAVAAIEVVSAFDLDDDL